jgi:hypothetical protein
VSDRKVTITLVVDVNQSDDDMVELVREAVHVAFLGLVDEYHALSFEDADVKVEAYKP